MTVCEAGGSGGDVGLASRAWRAEKLADQLILTSQTTAGWYRYIMKWKFHLDGRIEPYIGFAAVADSCIAFTHKHHAYWRLDFDIDGPTGDVVTEGPNPVASRRPPRSPLPGRQPPDRGHAQDRQARRSPGPSPTPTTRRGYRLVPGHETELPADTFSVGDVWVLKYKSNEIDDTGPVRAGLRHQVQQLPESARGPRGRPGPLVPDGRLPPGRRPRRLPRGGPDARSLRRLVADTPVGGTAVAELRFRKGGFRDDS